jgi:hypothetical protein
VFSSPSRPDWLWGPPSHLAPRVRRDGREAGYSPKHAHPTHTGTTCTPHTHRDNMHTPPTHRDNMHTPHAHTHTQEQHAHPPTHTGTTCTPHTHRDNMHTPHTQEHAHPTRTGTTCTPPHTGTCTPHTHAQGQHAHPHTQEHAHPTHTGTTCTPRTHRDNLTFYQEHTMRLQHQVQPSSCLKRQREVTPCRVAELHKLQL